MYLHYTNAQRSVMQFAKNLDYLHAADMHYFFWLWNAK